jgi:hypothetical protein
MFEFIGICVALLFGWIVLKVILCRVFPAYGFRVAEKAFARDPSDENERAVWMARSRLPANKRPW